MAPITLLILMSKRKCRSVGIRCQRQCVVVRSAGRLRICGTLSKSAFIPFNLDDLARYTASLIDYSGSEAVVFEQSAEGRRVAAAAEINALSGKESDVLEKQGTLCRWG